MKLALVVFSANLPSLACVLAAGYLATHDQLGWGWFLFLAVLLGKRITEK